MQNPFRCFNSSPEVIRLAVMMYIRYPLSLRQVEDLLFERGIDICHETVRFWWNRFGPVFAAEIRKRRVNHRSYSQWRWHLDEVFVKINGETHYLWRAVDHEGEVLKVFATKRRDRRAALKFLKRAMKRYGRPMAIVSEARDETLWSTNGNRDGPAPVLRSHDEIDWNRGASRVRSVAQQSGRKLTPTLPTTRRSHGALQGHQNPAEVHLRTRFDPQPLQPRPSPQPKSHIQGEALCRPGRVARTGGLKNPCSGTIGDWFTLD
jgi:transposase-like protein